MDSERSTRPTATTVAAPDRGVAVPRPRTAPAVESSADGAAVTTGPIPVAPADTPPDTVADTGPIVTVPAGAAPVVTPPATTPVANPCRCGHGRDAHEHFRRGTDCAGCDCAHFRRPSLLSRLRA